MNILFAVTNDISQDQRMARICASLAAFGHNITLVGRKKSNSLPLSTEKYEQKRLHCFFQKGKLFYLEYNLRLFVFALKFKADVFGATDLDTILPMLWAAKLKGKKWSYDAHEYFTEMEEVMDRPLVQKIWKSVEKYAVPKADIAYTVSYGYKKLFESEYPIPFEIIRNTPFLKAYETSNSENYLLYQGAVNYGRGLFEWLEAMPNIDLKLTICGEGDALDALKLKAKELKLLDKVQFTGFIKRDRLPEFTKKAFIGLTTFEKKGLSHVYSLANRFFDYIHAGIPQIAMKYPEYEEFNKEFEVAVLIENLEKDNIIKAVNLLAHDQELYQKLKANCLKARENYNWQAESLKLIELYKKLEEKA